MFNLKKYVLDENRPKVEFIFMSDGRTVIGSIRPTLEEIADMDSQLVSNFQLALNIGAEFLAIILPVRKEHGLGIFDNIDSKDGYDTLKELSIKAYLGDVGHYDLLIILPTSEDSISLMLFDNKTIIKHKILISDLSIQIGGNNA